MGNGSKIDEPDLGLRRRRSPMETDLPGWQWRKTVVWWAERNVIETKKKNVIEKNQWMQLEVRLELFGFLHRKDWGFYSSVFTTA
jgi:hypothetical protein